MLNSTNNHTNHVAYRPVAFNVETQEQARSRLSIAISSSDSDQVSAIMSYHHHLASCRNHQGLTPLEEAIQHGNVSIVDTMLQSRQDPDWQVQHGIHPLLAFALKHNPPCIPLLVRYGVDVNAIDEEGNNALIVAVREGNDAAVNALLACKGIKVNHVGLNGSTALMFASQNGHADIVTALLAHTGIKVNLANQEGHTALIYAAYSGHAAIVTALLARTGINVNHVNQYGYTALMSAAFNGHTATVTVLLAHTGINANLANPQGFTPLMSAAFTGRIAIVNALLARTDIDVNLADPQDFTALILAAFKGHAAIVAALLAHTGINANLASVIALPFRAATFARHLATADLLAKRFPQEVTKKLLSHELNTESSEANAVLIAALLPVCGNDMKNALRDTLLSLFVIEANKTPPLPEVLKRLASTFSSEAIQATLARECDNPELSDAVVVALLDNAHADSLSLQLAQPLFLRLVHSASQRRDILETLAAWLPWNVAQQMFTAIRQNSAITDKMPLHVLMLRIAAIPGDMSAAKNTIKIFNAMLRSGEKAKPWRESILQAVVFAMAQWKKNRLPRDGFSLAPGRTNPTDSSTANDSPTLIQKKRERSDEDNEMDLLFQPYGPYDARPDGTTASAPHNIAATQSELLNRLGSVDATVSAHEQLRHLLSIADYALTMLSEAEVDKRQWLNRLLQDIQGFLDQEAVSPNIVSYAKEKLQNFARTLN